MQVIVGLLYMTVLALVMTYAIGGLGLGVAIVMLLFTVATVMLAQAKHEETELAFRRPKHHHNAHGGAH